MKRTFKCPALRRAAALLLAAVLAMPTVSAHAGETRLQTRTDIAPGLVYRNTVTENNTLRVESFSLELAPGGPVRPILLQASGTIYGAASINRAVSLAREQGLQVLGAVNTDFFSTATGVPLGIVVENGIYKSSGTPESVRNAVAIAGDGTVTLAEDPRVSLTLTCSRTGGRFTPSFNKARSPSGGLYLLNRDFSEVSTRTSSPGWYVRMRVTDRDPDDPSWMLGPDYQPPVKPDTGPLTVNATRFLEVTEVLRSDQPVTIGPDEYILTADDVSKLDDVFLSFRVGDLLTLKTSCSDPALSAAQWAGGVGDIMVQDGVLTDSSAWTYTGKGRAPRTALGIREDGSLLLYAADGRQPGHSAGLSQTDLAEEMLAQGCLWAANLDGGGSTALSAWLPGREGPALVSRPSGGKPRACATFLLLVSEHSGDGVPRRLTPAENGLAVLTGSSVPLPAVTAVDSGPAPLGLPVSDVTAASLSGLGTVSGGIYTAGPAAGTDVLRLYSSALGLYGELQIHVVDTLTELSVTRTGEETPLTALDLRPGEKVPLSVSGSYWGRPALRSVQNTVWTADGSVGSVDEAGVFTASGAACTGSVSVTAGGLTRTVPVSVVNTHDDVPPEHWAYEAVRYCYRNGIVSGVSPTRFGPDESIRRGDFLLMLHKALGCPAPAAAAGFRDVPPEAYYSTAVSWGQAAGLASGVGGGCFAPLDPITREQAFTILYKALPLLGKACPDGSEAALERFPDRDLISGYARVPAATLVAAGLISGNPEGLAPRDAVTRAAAAAMLHNILTRPPAVPPEPAAPETPEVPDVPDVPGPGEPAVPGSVLTLDRTELTLLSGQSAPLSAALSPAVDGAMLLWTSSAPRTACVSTGGIVTNLSTEAAPVRVTVSVSWGGQTVRCDVTCEPPEHVWQVSDAEAGLRIRSGPGTEHPTIGKLSNGSRVLTVSEVPGWHRILFLGPDGQATLGFVSADYLQPVS